MYIGILFDFWRVAHQHSGFWFRGDVGLGEGVQEGGAGERNRRSNITKKIKLNF